MKNIMAFHKGITKIFWTLIWMIFTTLLMAHGGNGHNHIASINSNYYLYDICKNDIEGFVEKTRGSDFSYPSLREDVNSSMITRATSGKMFFEIITGKVPANYSQKTVTFFFYSDIDLNNHQPFDIRVNDKALLTFRSKEDGTLEILENPGNGKAEYLLIKRDVNSDGVGAFRLTVPVDMLQKGSGAKLHFRGHKKGNNCWFMIFKAKDAISRLKIAAKEEVAFDVKQKGEMIYLDAPQNLAGKKVYVKSDGKKTKSVYFKEQGELSKASFKVEPPKKSFEIYYGDKVLTVDFPKGDGSTTDANVMGEFFLYNTSKYATEWQASFVKLYRPEFFNTYNDFFDKRHEDGQVAVINSSHQDIAWVDGPMQCVIMRDTLLLTPILKDAFIREDYGFDIEDGMILREYLDRHPDALPKFTELLNRKLVSVGATYNCPYEDMYDAEDQVRQLYLGKKWVKKTFNGYDSKVYWNVDVPGKTMQYPQILKKAGVDYMVISRHGKGMFYWESPDGSSVFTYSPGHYGNDIIELSKEMGNKIRYGAEQVLYWDQYFENSKNHTPLLSDQDMLPAIDYSDFIATWNGFEGVKDGKGKNQAVHFPEMELMTVDEFLPLAKKNATSVDTIRGERPNVWVYIHGPAHHDALTASREGSKLIPAAEKFLSVANILDPKRMPYPTAKIEEAWLAKIFPDHGWGGHDGDITDDLFKEKLVLSRAMGSQLLDKATDFIASRVKTDESKGIPLVLFNSLSWERTDPVTVTINLERGAAKGLDVLTADKLKVPAQIAAVQYYKDGSIQSADLVFLAEKVPSIGYKTYYVKPLPQGVDKKSPKPSISKYENDFYTISFADGGIAQVYDKELKKNLLKTDRFMGAEVFTMESVGNGAGEFGAIQQPMMNDFDKVSLHKPQWEVVAQGDVYSRYRLKQKIRYAVVEQDVTLYHQLKRILFETKLHNWTGELYREFRTAFPLDMDNPTISHEVPFGTVRVGQDEIKTAGERYTPLCKDERPRAIIDWIAATDKTATVTLSSSVSAADWIDPTGENLDPVLQHVLLASRRSCHWEGNEYTQAGSHYYHNIFTSNRAEDETGFRVAKQQNEPLHVVVYPDQVANSTLPESTSFFSIDQDNVIITAVKKAEDNDGLIVRMYDTAGENATVRIKSFFDIGVIHHTNIIEENLKPVNDMRVTKYGIETFNLKVK